MAVSLCPEYARVEQPIILGAVEGEGTAETVTPVPTIWSYQPNKDPYAVAMDMQPGSDEPNIWLFGRQLPEDGLYLPSGMGEVQFWPAIGYIGMFCISPEGEAKFRVPTEPLESFLQQTYGLVPKGRKEEYAQLLIEGEMQRLLRAR